MESALPGKCSRAFARERSLSEVVAALVVEHQVQTLGFLVGIHAQANQHVHQFENDPGGDGDNGGSSNSSISEENSNVTNVTNDQQPSSIII